MPGNRAERASYDWIPNGIERVLDVGCGSGSDAARLTTKAREVYGVDRNTRAIERNRRHYPAVHFVVASAEQLPFPEKYFDAVVMSEVLEHVQNERGALNEAHRVLRRGGMLVLTVPHRGLFAFLDPANQKYHLQRVFPNLFRRFVAWKTKRNIQYSDTLLQGIHRHYSREDIAALLENSDWRGGYRISCTRYRGLLLGPLAGNIKAFFRIFVGDRAAAWLIRPLLLCARLENRFSFGKYSYQMELLLQKN